MIETIKNIFEEEFEDYKKTISDISYDSDNKKSLCDITDGLYFDYDKIVEKYYDNVPASPDIIHFDNDSILFIEFKNGKLGRSKDTRKIKLKGIEGAFIALYEIICSEMEENIEFEQLVKMDKKYIIVYNSKKNNRSRTGAITSYFNSFKVSLGLEIYETTFFRKINTLSEKNFMNNIRNIMNI